MKTYKRKDGRINNFWGTSVVDEIFRIRNDIATAKRLNLLKPKPYLELFTKDAIRWDLILNWYNPNDFL